MADLSAPQDGHAYTFTVASTAIPAGVRCLTCGRLHLPRRLLALRHDGGAIVLQCSRCGATGELDVDTSDPVHAEIVQAIVVEDSA